jgi:hypothetical protein
MKRLATWLACLLASLFLGVLPAAAQTAADYTQGVSVNGSTATIWFAPTSNATTWVDVHYKLNGGGQQNLRMALKGSRDEQSVAGVKPGDVLSYSFTYNKGSPAYDSAAYTYTVSGGTTGGGPVCFYADVNYSGASFCASASSTWGRQRME